MISKQRFITFHTENVNSICKVCNKDAEMSYQLHQKYFTILGLPLFPLAKIVYWSCNSCSVIKELKSGSTKTLDNFEQDILEGLKAKNNSQSDIRNYWGIILIILILGLLVYAVTSSS